MVTSFVNLKVIQKVVGALFTLKNRVNPNYNRRKVNKSSFLEKTAAFLDEFE